MTTNTDHKLTEALVSTLADTYGNDKIYHPDGTSFDTAEVIAKHVTENKPEAGAEAIRQIHDFESSLDCCAHELLTHATHETRELYHAFSKALQTDLRAKFGDVFENFPQP